MAKDHEIAQHLIKIINAYTLWPRLLAETTYTRERLVALGEDTSPTHEERTTQNGGIKFTQRVQIRETLVGDTLRVICNSLGLPYYDVCHLREVIPEDVSWCREMDRLGVEYTRSNTDVKKQSSDRSWISSVKLELTPEEWSGLCMRGGEFYIGGCCGNSSAQQDIMNRVFRDDGWIEAGDLRRLADLGISHDGDDSPYVNKSLLDHWGEPMDPWTKLGCLYQLCEPNLAIDRTKDLPSWQTDPVRLAEDALFDLLWEDHFRLFRPEPGKDDAAATSQHAALQLLHEAKYAAALTTLHAHYTSLQREPFHGFAIRKVAGKELAVNGYGACIYATAAQAQELLEIWAREEDAERYQPSNFEIAPCVVSLERGLEWPGGVL